MNSVTISDEIYSSNDILCLKLNKLTKKYFKYKCKYNEMKKKELCTQVTTSQNRGIITEDYSVDCLFN